MSKYLILALALTYAYYYIVSNEVQFMVWGCTSFSQCVVMVRTYEITNILINRVTPQTPKWCSSSSLNKKACKSYVNMAEVGVSVEGGEAGLMQRRDCADWTYACGGERNVTIWYMHFHKAGGSTFVQIAQANGARLMPTNSNGNPLDEFGERIPFWSYTGTSQANWAHTIRKKYGTDMVVTEFDFPPPTQLMAPVPFMYITILREVMLLELLCLILMFIDTPLVLLFFVPLLKAGSQIGVQLLLAISSLLLRNA